MRISKCHQLQNDSFSLSEFALKDLERSFKKLNIFEDLHQVFQRFFLR